MLAGETISFHDPEYPKIMEKVSQTMQLSAKLNTATDIQQAREILSQIIGTNIDESTTVFVPFHTNFGGFIQLGKMFLSTTIVRFWIWEVLLSKMTS
jgi:hypothetical protein